jgi:protein-tyrosine phosphatase
MKVFWVSERLAFGSKCTRARHVEALESLGITHVIDVRNYPGKKIRKFKTIHLNFEDDARPRPMWFYARALSFYEKALKAANAKVYVMCRAGRRRSASLTYFLLRASGVGARKAENIVRRARPCVQIVRAYRLSGEQFLATIRPAGEWHTEGRKSRGMHSTQIG